MVSCSFISYLDKMFMTKMISRTSKMIAPHIPYDQNVAFALLT